MDVCMWKLWQKEEIGKETGSESTSRFPQASCFMKMPDVCQKHGGARTTYYLKVQRYVKSGLEIEFPCSQERRKETST